MKKLLCAVLAGLLSTVIVGAYAGDGVKKDMSKGGMMSDEMKKKMSGMTMQEKMEMKEKMSRMKDKMGAKDKTGTQDKMGMKDKMGKGGMKEMAK